MTAVTTGSGKTAQAVRHLADRRLSLHKGTRRLWLEGRRLADIGFVDGVRYQLQSSTDGLTLKLSARGSHVVSHKQGRPVVDLLVRSLGDVERVQVKFVRGAVLVTIHPLDLAARERVARLNARLASGQKLRLGSLCHGGGIATDALLRGLGNASLAFGVELDSRYLEHALEHNPAWRHGAMSVEADLGDLDPAALGSCEVLEAGLPCVAASRAGRSKKGLERPEQDDQVADLACAFLEIIRATQPSVIVFENVPEYADSASADMIRRRLERWGYTLHEQMLVGAEWSLETRNRWVLIALDRGLSLDLGSLVPHREQATLAEVLDKRTPAAAWRTTEGKDRKQARDRAKGNRFQQRLLTAQATSVPTLRRGYQKAGSTDPRLLHPTRRGYSRLLSAAEHARIKGVRPALIAGASERLAHELLGQSVLSPAFVALGALIAQATA